MKLTLGEDVATLFPHALIGVIRVHDCHNAYPTEERRDVMPAEALLREAEAAARTALGGAVLSEDPRIACWREAYRLFGASPKKSPSSIESLLRRVLKGEALRPIHPLVDLYNAVSLAYVLPAGGEDLERIEGDILLCRAADEEPPVQLLGDAEARPPHPGEVIYRDARSAICRRWNWKEAERTKLTADTRHAVLVLEALPPHDRGHLANALGDLAARITRYCGGTAATTILDAASPSFNL